MNQLERVRELLSTVTARCFNTIFKMVVEYDQEFGAGENRRVYLKIEYHALCTRTGYYEKWYGRKWYLSKHMTDDEIIKTAYTAFESAVKHEVMEGFKVNGITLFDPHVHYQALLSVAHEQVSRAPKSA